MRRITTTFRRDFYGGLFVNLRNPNQRKVVPVHPDVILLQRIDAEIEDYVNNMESIPIIKKVAGERVMANKQRQLPLMSNLARRTLCIPATSAPSERLFSLAGLTITKFSSDTASAIVFLHDNWNLAEEYHNERANS
jgi:hAT family C-terminal dimerisation region